MEEWAREAGAFKAAGRVGEDGSSQPMCPTKS